MARYRSSQQATCAPQLHWYHAPACLATSGGDALTALRVSLDSESESCSSSGNDDNSESEYGESIRLRVHNRIMQRVQELHDAYNGHQNQPAAAHTPSFPSKSDQRSVYQSSNNKISPPVPEPGTDDLELLRQDVISVAAQILERRLHHEAHEQHPQQEQKRELKPDTAPSSSPSSSSSFELRLVHRMLAKESELLALQARRSHSGRRTRTANADRERIGTRLRLLAPHL